MGKAERMKAKGWFVTEGRDGDRTLEQQMIGLEQLFREVHGKTVLDAGAAEGLISIELAKAGAIQCVGLEIVAGHVEVGQALIGELPVTLHVANLNHYDVSQHGSADMVLALAVLHKLKDPSAVCAALARQCNDLFVIRLPPSGAVIVDDRSNRVPHDIGAVMEASGFTMESMTTGPFDEWLAYFRKVPECKPEKLYGGMDISDASGVPCVAVIAEPQVTAPAEPEVPVEPVAEAPVADEAPAEPEPEVASNRRSTRRVPRSEVKPEEVAPMGTDSGLVLNAE